MTLEDEIKHLDATLNGIEENIERIADTLELIADIQAKKYNWNNQNNDPPITKETEAIKALKEYEEKHGLSPAEQGEKAAQEEYRKAREDRVKEYYEGKTQVELIDEIVEQKTDQELEELIDEFEDTEEPGPTLEILKNQISEHLKKAEENKEGAVTATNNHLTNYYIGKTDGFSRIIELIEEILHATK